MADFCLNSRRWIDFMWIELPNSCPYREKKFCQYDKCGYWKDKQMTKYAVKKIEIIKSLGRHEIGNK